MLELAVAAFSRNQIPAISARSAHHAPSCVDSSADFDGGQRKRLTDWVQPLALFASWLETVLGAGRIDEGTGAQNSDFVLYPSFKLVLLNLKVVAGLKIQPEAFRQSEVSR